jgi:hypothetical protein
VLERAFEGGLAILGARQASRREDRIGGGRASRGRRGTCYHDRNGQVSSGGAGDWVWKSSELIRCCKDCYVLMKIWKNDGFTIAAHPGLSSGFRVP